MFKKIISNLSFSPALVSQLGFYAKRLRKEQTTRRIGMIFVALALVVQSLAVFQPPESANASSANDFVIGGLGTGSNRSLNNFLNPYDSNATHLKDIMNYVGITREEIAAAQFTSFTTGTDKLSWGRENRTGATTVSITDANYQKVLDVYARPMQINNGTNATIYGWVGQSKKMGWFAIMQVCGNLVTHTIPPVPTPPTPPAPPTPTPPTPTPPTPTPPTPAPKPAVIEVSKSATNITQGNVSASTVVAKENDKLTFTLKVKNSGGTAKEVELKDNLRDTLEYSTLTDRGGGVFNEQTQILSWPNVILKPGEEQVRTFAVQMKATIPTVPQGTSNEDSYNCVMENAFLSAGVKIPVSCAPPKVVENIVTELPHTGPTANAVFAAVVLAITTFFYFRSRQLGKEVRLIRRDLNAGTI
jgi:hypothetical protein